LLGRGQSRYTATEDLHRKDSKREGHKDHFDLNKIFITQYNLTHDLTGEPQNGIKKSLPLLHRVANLFPLDFLTLQKFIGWEFLESNELRKSYYYFLNTAKVWQFSQNNFHFRDIYV